MIDFTQKKHKLLRIYTEEEKEFVRKATQKYTGRILHGFSFIQMMMHFISAQLVFTLIEKSIFLDNLTLTFRDADFLIIIAAIITLPEYWFAYLSIFFRNHVKMDILEDEDYEKIQNSNYSELDVQEALEMNFLSNYYWQKTLYYLFFLVFVIIFI